MGGIALGKAAGPLIGRGDRPGEGGSELAGLGDRRPGGARIDAPWAPGFIMETDTRGSRWPKC